MGKTLDLVTSGPGGGGLGPCKAKEDPKVTAVFLPHLNNNNCQVLNAQENEKCCTKAEI